MIQAPSIDNLIQALRCLPGIGPKSAQRMAIHLLTRHRSQAATLCSAIATALEQSRHCARCNNLCDSEICAVCSNPKRNALQLCVVESPIDMLVIEQSGSFRGFYFVLMGHLSAIDGIGPNELHLDRLKKYLTQCTFEEVILATSATVEGDATAHYIASMVKPLAIKTTRIAHGVPLGSELEFIDGGTLARALNTRAEF